eukprot:2043168-Prymnesium_polylepis.1
MRAAYLSSPYWAGMRARRRQRGSRRRARSYSARAPSPSRRLAAGCSTRAAVLALATVAPYAAGAAPAARRARALAAPIVAASCLKRRAVARLQRHAALDCAPEGVPLARRVLLPPVLLELARGRVVPVGFGHRGDGDRLLALALDARLLTDACAEAPCEYGFCAGTPTK